MRILLLDRLVLPRGDAHAALVEHFTAAGVPAESAEMAAASIVSAREKAQKVA
jgi:hypothetical protein